MSLIPGSSARAQQHATRAAFFIPGFAAAVWAVLVPFAKARTGVDDGALGLILLCLGAGSFLAMPLAGAVSARFGFRAVMAVTSALICLSLPLLAVVADPWLLGAVLFVFGAGVGAMDCAMNMQAVVVERDAGRAMMSGFHAFFSIGGFVGAGAMTLLLSAQLSPSSAAVAGVIAMLLVAALAVRHWRTERVAQQGPLLALPRGIVLFIGILAFVVFLAEGTILDWSSVFLADVHQVAPEHRRRGLCGVCIDHDGDAPAGRCGGGAPGRIRSIVVGALLASAGFCVLTLVSPWQASLAGYVLVGLGCANIVPALFSLAGNQTRMPESIAITAVTTLGYAGILAGPALIGFAAHGIGLVGALLAVAVLMVGVAMSTRWLKV